MIFPMHDKIQVRPNKRAGYQHQIKFMVPFAVSSPLEHITNAQHPYASTYTVTRFTRFTDIDFTFALTCGYHQLRDVLMSR